MKTPGIYPVNIELSSMDVELLTMALDNLREEEASELSYARAHGYDDVYRGNEDRIRAIDALTDRINKAI